MTTNEAKKDVAERLGKAGVAYCLPLTAKTVSFEGFGMGTAIFVKVKVASEPKGFDRKGFKFAIPKPSEGGYMVEFKGGD